jgi:hypothetical protein
LVPAASQLPSAPAATLRYDGKTFDQWKQQLQTDLSPVLRKEAMYAMREFASHGRGNEVAPVIFDLVQSFPEHSRSAQQHNLEAAASYAAMQVPPSELLPYLKAALASPGIAQRRFAIELVPYAPQAETTALLVSAMNDSDFQVAAYARALLASGHPDNPQLNAWLNQALQGDDFKQLALALPLVVDTSWKTPRGQSLALSPRDDLLGKAVALLDHNDEEVAKLVRSRLLATRFDSTQRRRTLAALEAYFESIAPASSAKAQEVWKELSNL